MKYCDVTFKNMFTAVVHQRKIIVLFFVFFLIIGLLVGMFFSDDLSSDKSVTHVDLIPEVNFSDRDTDVYYYESGYVSVFKTIELVKQYIAILENESTLTQNQKEELHRIEDDFKIFAESDWEEIRVAFADPYSYFGSEKVFEQKEEALELFCEHAIAFKHDPEWLIEWLFCENIGIEAQEKVNVEDSLVAQFVRDFWVYDRKMDDYETLNEMFQNDTKNLLMKTEQIDPKFNDLQKNLNLLVNRLNQFVTQISNENALSLDAIMQKGRVNDIIITHEHKEQTANDVFIILVLFCTMTGICAGIYFAICSEYRGGFQKK